MKVTIISLLIAIMFAVAHGAISREECEEQGGEVVGDIGNGAVFQPGYVCESTDMPPTDAIMPGAGEPIAVEGEVCCGGTGEGLPPPEEDGMMPPPGDEGMPLPVVTDGPPPPGDASDPLPPHLAHNGSMPLAPHGNETMPPPEDEDDGDMKIDADAASSGNTVQQFSLASLIMGALFLTV